MRCPVDGEQLVMAERSGVEIDYCPRCRGVWLDRGELDKIIERSALAAAPPPGPEAWRAPPPPPPRDRDEDRRRRRDDDHEDYYRRKRRKSFLDELFDF